MGTTTRQSSIYRSVRMNDQELDELLDRLDESSDQPLGENLREKDRYRYRINNCVIHLQQPGAGTSVAYMCATRNLSESGIAVIHGGYVHKGSKCIVQLISTHGAWDNVPGAVVGCRYIEGSIHEVGIQFERTVDPGMYCPDAIKVTVLLIEDEPFLARMATRMLENLNATVDLAEDGEIGLEKAMNQSYDIIFMDIEMPVMNGLDATKKIREKGYPGMIVAMTALTKPEDRDQCLQAGCDRYIPKPYSKEDLSEVFELVKTEPLVSSLAQDSSMVEMINEFVSSIPKRVKELEASFKENDLPQVETHTRKLKGLGGLYGFEPICDAADKVEKAIQDEASESELKALVSELTNYCLLARSSARNQS